ncbi:MAG: hypothetical protein U5L11_02430 [Arhodomonas sp.]|nr:hypothetical protein [Arhodomonas sp.]
MKDLHNNIHIPSATVTSENDDTAFVSPIVDIQGYESLEFIIGIGNIADADATFAVLVEEGDESNLSDAAAVADAHLLGTEALAAFDFADDNAARKIGYVGNKRYVRCTVTPSNNASFAFVAIIPVQGHPANAPTPNPPA